MNQNNPSQEISNFLTEKEIKVFKELQIIIKELNRISNLTRLIEGDDYWVSQVYDSLSPFLENKKNIHNRKKFIDIGSGGGFPGLAYAITHKSSDIYLVDSSIKKVNALEKIKTRLKLRNKITVIHDRIEQLAHEPSFRNKFDICTTRAVGAPDIVSEYVIPLLNPNGIGILYCGKWTIEKEKRLNKALILLNGYVENKKRLDLPHNKGERNIIFIKTNGKCPITYPRAIGKPTKYPLGN
ncbi:MAG: 16S rRNA (guanine(527)-N(7))-methyltransferase RsmG [Prochlorococcus sp. SP3034]|nr:16S rRNA (guanine(527)-N(7))-methyltransferase RsmG [Prochlorococcus sp. SP3034]|tara:strand:- start:2335 stop:3054 length:720 start_codon:yes stop_codon:yes gene_type:complete